MGKMDEMKRDRRRYARVVVALESTVKTAGTVWRGKTVNLSPYGVKITFGQAVKLLPETIIRVQLVLPDQEPPLSLTARVIRSHHDGIAMDFVDPDQQDFQRLKALVDSLRAQG